MCIDPLRFHAVKCLLHVICYPSKHSYCIPLVLDLLSMFPRLCHICFSIGMTNVHCVHYHSSVYVALRTFPWHYSFVAIYTPHKTFIWRFSFRFHGPYLAILLCSYIHHNFHINTGVLFAIRWPSVYTDLQSTGPWYMRLADGTFHLAYRYGSRVYTRNVYV